MATLCIACLSKCNYAEHYYYYYSLHTKLNVKKVVGHFVRPTPNMIRQYAVLVRKCLMSDHYFKHCYVILVRYDNTLLHFKRRRNSSNKSTETSDCNVAGNWHVFITGTLFNTQVGIDCFIKESP